MRAIVSSAERRPCVPRWNARVACALLAGLSACGEDARVVRAYHASGQLESEGHEHVATDGTWELDGPFHTYHSNGARRANGAYSAGLRSGPWTSWYEDGAAEARGAYLFGEREGVWIQRAPNGSIDRAKTGVYENGERITEYVVDGVLSDAYGDGQLRERVTCRDGLRHGLATTWHPNGARRSEGRYSDGRRSGRWTYWNEDGSVDPQLSGLYDGWTKTGN